MNSLPYQLLSFLGEFLELREIGTLLRLSKSINQKIGDQVFFHFCKSKLNVEKLPKEFNNWKDFVREATGIKFGSYLKDKATLSKDSKRITCKSGKGWSCALSNLSFSRGKHFLRLRINKYHLSFLGVAFKETPLDSPCFGKDCFAYSSYYKDYRQNKFSCQ